MNGKYSLSIILPIYNEEENINKVIEGVANFLQVQNIFEDYEIIIIDDGSKDNTAKIIERLTNKIPYLKVITHSKNLGYGRALTSGIRVAQYPLILLMDADGQYGISEINKFMPYIENHDIITGYRYRRADVLYRIILGKIYTWLVLLLFGLKLKDVNCGFKLFKREVLNFENIYNSNAGVFYTEILLKAKNKGYKIKETPIEHLPRLKGRQTGASPKVIFHAVVDLIKLKYSLVRDKINN